MSVIKEDFSKFGLIDFVIFFMILVAYSILSFHNLGDIKAPNTFYSCSSKCSLIVDLKSTREISKIKLFNGVLDANYQVYISLDGNFYNYLRSVDSNGVFSWDMLDVSAKGRYLRFDFLSDASIGEIGIYDSNNKLLDDVLILNEARQVMSLSDEKEIIPERISYMNSMYFDEVYFARTAYEYVFGIRGYEWTHPPLGKVIQAFPILVTHYMSPFNYRLMGNISGIILIGVMYIFGLLLFKKRIYGICASLLMILDTFFFAHTRMGTIDSHLVLFITLAILFMYLFTRYEKIRYLFFAGLFFGLSVSVKWTGFYCGIGLAILYFIYLFKNKLFNMNYILLGSLFFVVVPLVIYCSIFMLFSNNLYKTNTFDNIIKENREMYIYHAKLGKTHAYSSKWYTWPISYRPVWYYNKKVSLAREETIAGVGNIVIWIGGCVGFIYSLFKLILRKDKICFLLVTCVLSLWIPYALVSRIMFLYHFFPVLPFWGLSLLNMLVDLTNSYKMKFCIPLVLFISLLFFIIFFPVVSGVEIQNDYLIKLELFDSWDFS